MLAPRYYLLFKARDKPVVDAADIYALLEYYWVYDTYVYTDER